MNRDFCLDPEVEALLAEVARQPESRLLRVPRPAQLRPLFEREPSSSGEPFLSRAERHLIDAHREEVASLLADLCLLVRRRDPTKGRVETDIKTATSRQAGLSEQEVRRRTETLVRWSDAPAESGAGVELLTNAQRSRFAAPSALALAQASLRLVPGHRARLLAAQDLSDAAQYRSAEIVFENVLQARARPAQLATAWEGIGRIRFEEGDSVRAAAAYRHASDLAPDRCLAAASWLFNEALLGREEGVRRASARLADSTPANHRFLDWYLGILEVYRDSGRWRSSEPGRAVARRLRDSVAEAPRRVVDVLS